MWSWDISHCPSVVRGQHWYLYLIMGIYSRKIVAWEIHEAESGELARKLVERALLREGCWHNPPVLHSDNGAPMTSYMLKARLAELGMLMSHSRPKVSNDDPYSESLFRTVKYCPEWPSKGFESLTAVRDWMLRSSTLTTNSTCTAASGSWHRLIDIAALTTSAWRTGNWFMKEQSARIHGAGLAIPGTGK